MKKLLIITLTLFCYSHISAGDWLAQKWKQLKNYGRYNNIDNLPYKNAAEEIAWVRYLYGPQTTPSLIEDYKKSIDKQKEALRIQLRAWFDKHPTETRTKTQEKEADGLLAKHHSAIDELTKQRRNLPDLVELCEQEYEKPWSFWQYQHPNRFEY